MTYAIARPTRLRLDAFAVRAGLHPQLVRRFVALGLVEADRDHTGELWFRPAALVTVARVQRLHAGLSLNYAAIGLVLDLLDRIEELEQLVRTREGVSHGHEPVDPEVPGGPARRADQGASPGQHRG